MVKTGFICAMNSPSRTYIFLIIPPSHKDSNRGREIKEWLESTDYDITSYVIIDDEIFDIRDLHKGHMVKTSFNDGIAKRGVDMAIEILSKQHNLYND